MHAGRAYTGATDKTGAKHPMKIKLHHVNFCSTNVPALDAFYRDVLDLQPEPSLEAGRILDKDGYPGRGVVHDRLETRPQLRLAPHSVRQRYAQRRYEAQTEHV